MDFPKTIYFLSYHNTCYDTIRLLIIIHLNSSITYLLPSVSHFRPNNQLYARERSIIYSERNKMTSSDIVTESDVKIALTDKADNLFALKGHLPTYLYKKKALTVLTTFGLTYCEVYEPTVQVESMSSTEGVILMLHGLGESCFFKLLLRPVLIV